MASMDGKACGYPEKSFHKGITNGAEWYQVPGKRGGLCIFSFLPVVMQTLKFFIFIECNPEKGGMEDYNYLYGDCFEITIELTCCKYPWAKELEKEWYLNQNSLWSYTMQAYQRFGINFKLYLNLCSSVRGTVTDSSGNAVSKAVIKVDGIDKEMILITDFVLFLSV